MNKLWINWHCSSFTVPVTCRFFVLKIRKQRIYQKMFKQPFHLHVSYDLFAVYRVFFLGMVDRWALIFQVLGLCSPMLASTWLQSFVTGCNLTPQWLSEVSNVCCKCECLLTTYKCRYSILVNVNAGHGRNHVSMWHIFHEMILAARVRLIDQEYGNVYESTESVYPRGLFLEMILAQGFACWPGIWKCLWKCWKCVFTWHIPWNDSCGKGSLVDQEYGNVYESAESVYFM